MKAPAFSYAKPTSLSDCLSLLSRQSSDAQILAGGQSLMPMLNLRLAAPAHLVDIGALDALRGIRLDGDQLVVGALETHAAIAASALVVRHAPLLAQAAPHIAHVAIRSRGTIGGSVALADPAAEWPACCLALDARIELANAQGVRRVAAADFFQGLYATARAPDELVTAIRFPIARAASVHAFDEVSRRRGDYAIAGLALAGVREGDVLRDLRIALLGVSDRPVLASSVMAVLEGQRLEDRLIADAVQALAGELDPLDDPAYPAAYRRRVAAGLAARVLHGLAREVKNAG